MVVTVSLIHPVLNRGQIHRPNCPRTPTRFECHDGRHTSIVDAHQEIEPWTHLLKKGVSSDTPASARMIRT